MEVRNGRPHPLGATWDGGGVNVALYSAHAERVELLLFRAATDAEPEVVCELPARSGDVWHAYLPGLEPGWLYGYRVHGPFAPERGHRFNDRKVLLDPYARELGRPLEWDDSLFGYPVDSPAPDLDLQRNGADSAPHAPLGRIRAPSSFDWGDDQRPNTPWQETIIYEAHVKGLTMQHPEVP